MIAFNVNSSPFLSVSVLNWESFTFWGFEKKISCSNLLTSSRTLVLHQRLRKKSSPVILKLNIFQRIAGEVRNWHNLRGNLHGDKAVSVKCMAIYIYIYLECMLNLDCLWCEVLFLFPYSPWYWTHSPSAREDLRRSSVWIFSHPHDLKDSGFNTIGGFSFITIRSFPQTHNRRIFLAAENCFLVH